MLWISWFVICIVICWNLVLEFGTISLFWIVSFILISCKNYTCFGCFRWLFGIFIIPHISFFQNPSNQIRKCLIGVWFLDDVICGFHEGVRIPNNNTYCCYLRITSPTIEASSRISWNSSRNSTIGVFSDIKIWFISFESWLELQFL